MLVLFDSCWHPEPTLGAQRHPAPGVHNSGWVQSPGVRALSDPSQHGRLEAYVTAIVSAFAHDPRVIAWDVWNEPDNDHEVDLCDPGMLERKAKLVTPLLVAAFRWARACKPSQPLTSGIWLGDWSAPHRLTAIQRAQLSNSDVISFHNYGRGGDFRRRVGWLRKLNRPLLCTEFMARRTGSTFQAVLPFAKRSRVAAFCWGLVAGRTQTHLAWDVRHNRSISEGRAPWFHDVLHSDGRPHLSQEAAFLRRITGRQPAAA